MTALQALEQPAPQAGTPAAPACGRLLEVDAAAFRAGFDRKPFLINHYLCDHPLFALPRLLELSRQLPAGSVEYNSGDLAVNQNPKATPMNGLSVEETVRRIEHCRSWMVLKNVEQHPDYRDLLHRSLAEVEDGYPIPSAVGLREGFIFLSSPHSVTPYHIDPEHNFLLQIRGDKTVRLFPADDRALLSEEQLERFYSGAHRNLTFAAEYEQKASAFRLPPGVGLYFPVTAPHWVQNGPAVSVSFSITFQTRATERRAAIYSFNHFLRGRGLKPVPAGQSPVRDWFKYNAVRAGRRLSKLWPRRAAAGPQCKCS